MKITIEYIKQEDEQEIIIRTLSLDDSIQNLISVINRNPSKLTGSIGNDLHIIDPNSIFYIESVDNKLFIYGDQSVYESHKTLYEFEEELKNYNFFRSSKSMILNIDKIISVRPMFDSRYEAYLKNHEKVYISRTYVSVLKQKLGL